MSFVSGFLQIVSGLFMIAFIVLFIVWIARKVKKTDTRHTGIWTLVVLCLAGIFMALYQQTPAGKEEAAESIRAESSESRADSISESKESRQESKDEAKTHVRHTTGLSGLEFQSDKYLQSDDVLTTYKPVHVKGVDSNKPYFANIIVSGKGESKETMEAGALSIVKGIQHTDYNDFHDIKISFEQDLTFENGQEEKSVPVLVYTLTPKTIKQLRPDNMSNDALLKLADEVKDKHVKGD